MIHRADTTFFSGFLSGQLGRQEAAGQKSHPRASSSGTQPFTPPHASFMRSGGEGQGMPRLRGMPQEALLEAEVQVGQTGWDSVKEERAASPFLKGS